MEILSELIYQFKVIEVKPKANEQYCKIYKMFGDDGGYGYMTIYEVFPGIIISYNDFHMANCPSECNNYEDVIEINHCCLGRYECEYKNGSYVYLQEGDLALKVLNEQIKVSSFPLEHYHGISVVIDIPEANDYLKDILGDINIDIYDIKNKLCRDDKCFIMRATDSIQHIFSELYTVPDKIKMGYFKLKVMELLLFLSAVDYCSNYEERTYFPKNQVEKIKEIRKYITDNFDEHYTLQNLADKYDISVTALKLCFKGVYGSSLYSYLRAFRMEKAVFYLNTTDMSIAEISGKVGFCNSSKFASAFRDIKGVSPTEYKRNSIKYIDVGDNFSHFRG